ncbi:hypothetical protein SeMB42_g01958 [Synchytrium endobioticum]|uniref:Casein kinase II subunit beta n=1 Tax=Synchytrium endobioticum TaxID=286115 RepID=A0A507DI32_9FUNG|nr:hypothetical protein SeMB42_g01958 [Synchytrium endobioticum]
MSEDGSESSYGKYWVEWFQQQKGNEFFCEVDEDYILDRFNLTGLYTQVRHYNLAFDTITDAADCQPTNHQNNDASTSSSSLTNLNDMDDETRAEIEKAARHLYGLIHARYVLTAKGLAKMAEKYRSGEFGRCPRVLCHNQLTLPVGLSDLPGVTSVKLYCPKCEDIYNPPYRRHVVIDGAYFGTTLPHLLLQVHPNLIPTKTTERYVPRIFGFKLHSIATEHRKQDEVRQHQIARLDRPLEAEE